MLYKILLTIDLQEIPLQNINHISDKLMNLSWFCIDSQKTTWKAEKIASDVITAKFKIERELQHLLQSCHLSELNYAFQLSLGEISTGKLKSI